MRRGGAHSGYGSSGGLSWSDENPVWSPNGRRIAFDSNRADPKHPVNAVYVMHADGSGVRRLTPLTGEAELPSWSPDGTQIAYVSNLTQVASYAPDGVYTDAAAEQKLNITHVLETHIHADFLSGSHCGAGRG